MGTKSSPPKRKNRTVQLGDMIGNALDPALKRRGFASRDLIANWTVIAPPPWNTIAMPDKLVWPRRDRPEPEGAVLHLRCVEGHGLALAHEGGAIAAAVNRYFGYLLVGSVRLSLEPFAPASAKSAAPAKTATPEDTARVKTAVAGVEDEGLQAALARLGAGILGKDRA